MAYMIYEHTSCTWHGIIPDSFQETDQGLPHHARLKTCSLEMLILDCLTLDNFDVLGFVTATVDLHCSWFLLFGAYGHLDIWILDELMIMG